MSYFCRFSVSPSPAILALEVRRGRSVGGDDGALALQVGLVEQLVELARLVDAARDQHGVAASALQPVPGLHVHQDVGDDLFQPRLAGEHLLHRAPALLELRLGEIGQALGLGLEPLVDLRSAT